jgi:hypothetical protein
MFQLFLCPAIADISDLISRVKGHEAKYFQIATEIRAMLSASPQKWHKPPASMRQNKVALALNSSPKAQPPPPLPSQE